MRTKSEERRDRIIEAAAKLFAKQGFDNASMAAITAKVGGSKATIYNYFKSKEEIFVCATEKIAENHKNNLCDGLKKIDDPIEETLSTFCYTLIKFLTRKEIIAAKRMIMAPNTPKEISTFFFAEGPKYTRKVLADYFQSQIDKGVLINADPMKIATQLTSVLIHSYHDKLMLQMDFNPSEDEIKEHVKDSVDLILYRYLAK